LHINLRATWLWVAIALVGCNGSNDVSGSAAASQLADPRATAIEALLNAQPSSRAQVYAGFACEPRLANSAPYKRIPGAHVSGIVLRPRYEGIIAESMITAAQGTVQCRKISWDPSTGVRATSHQTYASAQLGHFIVDKLGEDQQQMGVTVVPFQAHFAVSRLGKALIAAQIAGHAPRDIASGSAAVYKDVDGKLVARF
jgi:hypothetical protein